MEKSWIHSLYSDAGRTLRRFPHVLLCAALCSTLLCVQLHYGSRYEDLFLRLIMAISLGIPGYFGLALFDERYTMRRRTVHLMHGLLAAGLTIYFFTIPENPTGVSFVRFVLLAIMAHMAVSFLPFIVNREMNAFWQYNRILFVRFLTAFLFSITLYGGLALAIYAIEQLFRLSLPDNLPLYILFWMATLKTWIFLTGIPERVELLEQETNYPKGIKIFAGYVLMPLVILFMVILYAYSIKSWTEQKWPSQLIISLILTLTVSGTLAYLLLWPFRKSESSLWIASFYRLYFIILLPLVVLMSATTIRQLYLDYVTVEDFLLLVLCVTVIILSFYFIFSKAKSLKMIPVALFLAALSAGFGPFNAFDVSRSSQLNEIKKVLRENDRFDKLLKNSEKAMKKEDAERVSQLFYALIEMNGIEPLRPYLSNNQFIQLRDSIKYPYAQTDEILKYVSIATTDEYSNEMYFTCRWSYPYKLNGYDYFTEINLQQYGETFKDDYEAESPFHWSFENDAKDLLIYTTSDTVRFRNSGIFNRLEKNKFEKKNATLYNDNPNFLIVAASPSGKLKVQLRITDVTFLLDDRSLKFANFHALCFVTITP